MAISRFDEGTLSDALVGYWSATESAIDKTGNNVNSVTSVYGLDHPVVLTNPNQPTAEITHGLETVGAMPAFFDNITNTSVRLSGTVSDISVPSSGLSIVIVGRKTSTAGGQWFGGMASDGGTTLRSAMRTPSSGDRNYLATALRTSSDSGVLNTLNATKWGLFQGTTDNSSIHRIDDAEYPMGHGTTSDTLAQFVLFNTGGSSNADNMRGYISIALLYNRQLDATERQDVFDLCDYWLANNEAPASGPGPSATFGPVTTNDDPSVTQWQWEASADGGTNWDNAENVMSDVSGETTITLTVNSATIAEDQTQVRCRAYSAKEPAGVVSHTATLTVIL